MSNGEENYDILCVWEVKNFNRYCVGVELWSPVLTFNSLDSSQWRIALCVDNYDKNSSYFFNFRLKCVSDDVPTDKIDCELSIMDANGSPLQKTGEKNCDFSTFGYYSLESLKVSDDVFGLDECKFFPEGTLTVRCRMQKSLTQSRNSSPELHLSSIRLERSSFLWTLENFPRLQPFQKSKMHLMQNDSNSPVVSFEFFFDDYERFQVKVTADNHCAPIDASFKISVLDANRQVCKTEDFSLCKSSTSLSLKRRELVDNKTLYLPMSILTLQVECFFTEVEDTGQFLYQELYAIRDTAKNPILNESSPLETLSKDDLMTGDN